MPGNRDKLQTWNLDPKFHQRVAIGRTRIYKDKQYMQRIEEFFSRSIISLPKRLCEKSTQRKYKCRFLTASKNNWVFRTLQNNQNDTRIYCKWLSDNVANLPLYL